MTPLGSEGAVHEIVSWTTPGVADRVFRHWTRNINYIHVQEHTLTHVSTVNYYESVLLLTIPACEYHYNQYDVVGRL